MNRRVLSIVAAGLALAGVAEAAQAQSSPSAYTTGYRYDAAGRLTGTISPDPDGAGALKYAAVRNTYDAAGRLVKVEIGDLSAWKTEAVAPASWGTAFSVLSSVETAYDTIGRKTKVWAKGSNGATVSLTQHSYDNVGRLQCTAVRMNPAAYGSLPANPCALGTQGGHGPDRITKTVYDAAGQVLQIRKAVGTSIEIADVTYSYTANGKIRYVIDANGNKAERRYDGHDRQVRWVFPSKTAPGLLNEADYELYGYDAGGNRISLRKRDGSTLTYQYDALSRMTRKTVPNRSDLATTHERDVFYGYDLRGLQTYARFDSAGGQGVATAYDGFGRVSSTTVSLDGQSRQLSYLYDRDGNRTRITHPGAAYFKYGYDGLDRLNSVKNSAAQTLVAKTYNNRALPASAARYSSAHDQTFTYDTASRLSGLGISGGQTTSAVSWSFTRNPAGQLLTEARTNDSYAWGGHVNLGRTYTTNGLNQYTAVAGAGLCYDANGNLTADGTKVYKYDVENRLVEMRVRGAGNTNCAALSYTGALQATLRYDPLGRLHELGGSGGAVAARFLYDGDGLVAEYNSAGTLLRRYVHGADADADDPLIWFEGASTAYTSARHLYADPRGSIVLTGNSSGAAIAINSYDEYGIPGSTNQGRFQYTGQAWLPELGMYYYKARIYSPTLGRFLQTDPIGYEDQFNLYAYVGNDPVNGLDPTGLCEGENCTINVFHPELDQQVEPIKQKIGKNIAAGVLIGASFVGPEIAVAGSVARVGVIARVRNVIGRLFGATKKSGEAAKTVTVSRTAHPEAAAHIERAQAAGQPRVLTVDRAGATARRREALRDTPTRRGQDRDEYPPAMFEEGGRGSSVGHVRSSDNRGAGASIGQQCRSVSNGGKVNITVCN